MADKVGDSLELSLYARDAQADIIVFAGVRFMAKPPRFSTRKRKSSCPTPVRPARWLPRRMLPLRAWRESYPDHVHVSYINSSAEHKALSDWIVTSRNVDDIIAHLYAEGKR